MAMVLSLSAFWMTMFLFLDKCLSLLNSEVANNSDGLGLFAKRWYDKGSKKPEYLMYLDFTENRMPLHKRPFSSLLDSYKEKSDITLLVSWLLSMTSFNKICKRFFWISIFECHHDVKWLIINDCNKEQIHRKSK